MQRKICVNKKTFYLSSLLVIIGVAIVFGATTLLNTKTQYKSRASAQTGASAIFGGNEAREGQWPFMVRIIGTLNSGKEFGCGGSLIAPGWVLTAGHCAVGINYENLSEIKSLVIKAGSIDPTIGSKHELFDTKDLSKSIFLHDKYKLLRDVVGYFMPTVGNRMARYDVALLKLKTIPVSNNIPLETISVYAGGNTNLETEGQPAVILGWGKTETAVSTHRLQQAIIPILSKIRDIKNALTNDESEIIGGYPKGDINVCYGDSGSPFLVWNGIKWVQFAVTAYGVGTCGKPGFYAGFGRLPFFSRWVIDTIKSNGLPTYTGVGTYRGEALDSTVLKTYYQRICENEDWGSVRPQICNSQTTTTAGVKNAKTINRRPVSIIPKAPTLIPTMTTTRTIDKKSFIVISNLDGSRTEGNLLAGTKYYACIQYVGNGIDRSKYNEAALLYYTTQSNTDGFELSAEIKSPGAGVFGKGCKKISATRAGSVSLGGYYIGYEPGVDYSKPYMEGISAKMITFPADDITTTFY